MQACKWCGSPVAKVVPKHLDEDRSWVGGYIQFACSSEFWNESSEPFWDRTLVCRLAEKDARIATLTSEVERLKELLASLPAAARSVGKPGPGGVDICGGIPSEVYVAIGRERYETDYEVAEATAESMRENTASYIERLIKDHPHAQ